MNRPPVVPGSRILGLLLRIVCNVTGEISRAVWDLGLRPPTPSLHLLYSERFDSLSTIIAFTGRGLIHWNAISGVDDRTG